MTEQETSETAEATSGKKTKPPRRFLRANTILFICNFLSKGWEIGIIGFAVFIGDKYHLNLKTVGLLTSVFLVSQIAVSFFAGKITHTVSGKNVIFLSITASAMAWLTLILAGHHISLLYLAYILGGVSSGLFEPIGNSMVAKLAASGNRSSAIGNFAACGDMGKIGLGAAATALAGFIGVNDAAAVMLLSAIVVFFLVSFVIGNAAGNGSDLEDEEPVHLRDLMDNTNFGFATLAGIADSFASASLYVFIPILLKQKGIPLDHSGLFIGIFFAGYLSGRLALGRLADKHGAPRLLMASKVIMSALLLVLAWIHGVVAIGVVLYLLGIVTRGSAPLIRAMVADSMQDNVSFHNAFSVFSTASRGASAVSRPIYGVVADTSIFGVFYVASAVSILTLYPAIKYKCRSSLSPALPQPEPADALNRRSRPVPVLAQTQPERVLASVPHSRVPNAR